jgi:alkanesulfonate monooxygenase SsuD/methylene tetrahydromethanopterin reductase-like flavin-dependent oxidoreductase (luciferase family)
MTNKVSPDQFRQQWGRITALADEEGRDPAQLGNALYHNININEDRQAALEESKGFLETYYSTKFSPVFVKGWTTAGSPRECIAELRAYFDAGVQHITLRLASWDQQKQLKRFLTEVIPAFGAQ